MSFSAWSPVIVSPTTAALDADRVVAAVGALCQESATAARSRGSAASSAPSAVLTMILPSRVSTHTVVDCGDPSGLTVARCQKFGRLERLRARCPEARPCLSPPCRGRAIQSKRACLERPCPRTGTGPVPTQVRGPVPPTWPVRPCLLRPGGAARRRGCAGGGSPGRRRGRGRSRSPGRAGSRAASGGPPGRGTRCPRRPPSGRATWRSPTIARVTRSSAGPAPTRSTSGRAILTTSKGSWQSSSSDERPVPKSSSAKRTPSRRSSDIVSNVASGSAVATCLRDLQDQAARVEPALQQRRRDADAEPRVRRTRPARG